MQVNQYSYFSSDFKGVRMSKRHWILVALTVFILAALMLPACTKEETTVTTPKTLKLSYDLPKGASVSRGFEWFGPEFEKRTEGRYKVEIYPSSTLVSIAAALDGVKGGMCDIIQTSVGNFPKDFPLTGVVSLPALGFSMNNEANSAVAYKAVWELYNDNKEIQNEFKDYKLVNILPLYPYNLISKSKEVHAAADFKGMKVGGSGGKMDIVSANGGAAVQQVPPQTYDNMQKGVIEAAFVAFSQVHDYHLYDLADYFYTQNFGAGCIVLLMNLNSWNAMSSKDQKIMMETWTDSQIQSSQGSLDNVALGKKETLDKGKKITDPSAAEVAAWVTGAQPAFDKWKKDNIALGVDAATIDKILKNWMSIRDKYLKQMK
jgi:TRAP-type transport system periplasmic protein